MPGDVPHLYRSNFSGFRNNYIEVETKWLPFRRRYFQMLFLEWKMDELRLRFHWSLFLSAQLTHTSIGSDNGLAPTRRQAIIWTSGGKFADAHILHSASKHCIAWIPVARDLNAGVGLCALPEQYTQLYICTNGQVKFKIFRFRLWVLTMYLAEFKNVLLSGVPDYFGRNKISSGGDLSHYSSASLY